MKKRLVILCLAIASVSTVFYSCSEDVAESIKGSIVGTVTDDTTGELISVAKVLLKPDNKSTVTGSDGTFEFNELDAGKYTVEITKTGYEPNTTEIVVSEGQVTESHILMERIPAIITADKEVLDFGANSTVTSLSFNIVNKSYKALEWSVDCTSVWVSSIEPKTSGKLDYGKTATLIVKIDRNKLESGYNESYLVVFSEDGSVEVKLTAIGAETAAPVLNILEATDVKSSSVRLNAKIINPGIPEYTKRGFVYGVSADPTIDNVVLQAEYDDKAEFSCEATNLTLGTTYYVRAYAINKMKGEEVVTYSANSIQIATKATSPKVAIAEVTSPDVEKKTAVLNGVVVEKGDPSYSEKGFVYGKANNPTIESNVEKLVVEGDTAGEYSALATGLELDVNYYVRAYVINEAGVVYSEEAKPFKLGTTLPEVSISDVTDKDVEKKTAVLNGCVDNVGTPAYQEKGFVYSTTNNPTIETATKVLVDGKTAGKYSVEIADLQRDVTYYVRAYVISETGTVYSKEEKSFSLETILPEVTMNEVTIIDLSTKKVTFTANIEKEGLPAYTERGFVYGESFDPVVGGDASTTLRVSGYATNYYFEATTQELKLDTKYYARAYLKVNDEIFYSKNSPFSLEVIPPSVEIMEISESDKDISRRSVTLKANVTKEGKPSYTEKGFVYSDKPSPTIYDNIITVDGRSGTFSAPANNLELDKVYYVRAYIKNEYDTYYSENEDFELTSTHPQAKMVSVTSMSYSAKRAKFTGKIENVGNPSYSQRGFVYGFNSNPTIENDLSEVVGGDATEFSINVPNLTTGQKYFVRVFVEQNKKYFYSNELDFTLTPTPASIGEVVVGEVTKNSAKVTSNIANVGDPEYTERGFVYNVEGNPNLGQTIDRVVVSGNADGDFSARLTGLSSNTTYYVRAYVLQNGQEYYGTEKPFTTDKQAAVVGTNEATNVMFTTATLNATITNIGDPVYNRRGFYYGTSSNPTSANSTTIVESESSLGAYSKDITGLQEKTKYYYRAFLMQPGETNPILGEVKYFTTGHAPNVTTGGVINVSCTGTEESNLNWSAMLYGGVSDEGNPAFTEFGFVYGTTSQPKVDDGSSTYTTTTTYELQNGDKIFSKTISGLTTGTTYYIRAVAKTPLGYVYGEPIVFTPAVIAPSIRTYEAKCYYANDTYGWVVEFYGVAATSSQPPITGLGFVYGTKTNPTIGDESSIEVSYKAIEKQDNIYVYGAGEIGLKPNQIYYVRTYAKTALGYTYGEVLSFWTY